MVLGAYSYKVGYIEKGEAFYHVVNNSGEFITTIIVSIPWYNGNIYSGKYYTFWYNTTIISVVYMSTCTGEIVYYREHKRNHPRGC